MSRNIDDVLFFRNDISPFLVHLTKDTYVGAGDSKDKLENILSTCILKYGQNAFSDARFRYPLAKLDNAKRLRYFCAISFTETPINEIHNLLEIFGRKTNLRPYGLIFLKARLRNKGVSPVLYINNIKGDKDKMIEALCDLIDNKPRQAAKILPYIALFGKHLKSIEGNVREGFIDFMWEREWRYASKTRQLKFVAKDIFIGLCPHNEIHHFESKFSNLGIKFVDPMMNMKWYADKLLDARHRSKIKYSVV